MDRNHPNEPEPVHGVLRGTLLLAFQVMLCCLAIGFPAALFLWRRQGLWPHLATALVTLVLVVTSLVTLALGWRLRRRGELALEN